MNLPSGDPEKSLAIIFDSLLGVFVSGIVRGLRRHMTRAGHDATDKDAEKAVENYGQ